MLNEMSSDEFFTEITKLIDKFGSDAVINAAKHIEIARNKYRYVSKDQNAFRNFTQPNAASPKRYKDCWITQDYNKAKKRDIFERLRYQLKVKIVPKPVENKSTPHTSSRPSVSHPSSGGNPQGEISHSGTGSGGSRRGGYGDRVDNLLPEEISETEILCEGARKQISVNTYERDRSARDKCLQYYGTRCTVCAQDMSEIYGPEAAGLIHVHHLKPLSEIKGDYQVNPIADLRPVCPNCHAVIHRRRPPYKIEEVKGFLEKVRQDG